MKFAFKWKDMKKLEPKHKAYNILSLFFVFTAILFSCSKEMSEQVPPSSRVNSVQFAVDQVSVAENEAQKAISLKLGVAAAKAERISLTITSTSAEYGKDYTTEPAAQNGRITLTVESGRSESNLLIKPINNSVVNAERELRLQIAAEGSSVKPEGRTSMRVILADDDVTHAAVSFAATSVALLESHTAGHLVDLSISPAAALAGSVDLNLTTTTNATYGQHFTTEPAAVNGRLQLPVAQGANKISFRIKPVNDAIVNDPRLVRVSVGQLSAGLQAGQQTNFLLTINNDDAPQANITSIAAIRNGYTGTDTYVWGGTVISGIVTSVSDNIAPNVVYIEDATGGIALRFTTNHNLQPGQVVSIDIDGSILSRTEYGIEIRNLPLSSSSQLGWDLKVLPSYTLQSLYEAQGNLEGRAVTLTNVRFNDANGTATLHGSRTITDGTRTATVRTETFASFANRIIPGGAVSIMGILVRQNGSYIIRPLTAGSIY